jgi:hypothetical protein
MEQQTQACAKAQAANAIEPELVQIIQSAKIGAASRKFVLEIAQHVYEWVHVPKTWWKRMVEHQMDTDAFIRFANWLHSQFSHEKALQDLSADEMDNILSKRYKQLLTLLDDTSLGNDRVWMVNDYFAGNIPGIKKHVKCKTYCYNKTADTVVLALMVKGDAKDRPRKPRKDLESDFSVWQLSQFETLTIDLKGALERLMPKRGDAIISSSLIFWRFTDGVGIALPDGRVACSTSFPTSSRNFADSFVWMERNWSTWI